MGAGSFIAAVVLIFLKMGTDQPALAGSANKLRAA
jgi:hypothetical protein